LSTYYQNDKLLIFDTEMSYAIKHTTDDIFFFQEDSALVHMHCACNTVQLLQRYRLPFS